VKTVFPVSQKFSPWKPNDDDRAAERSLFNVRQSAKQLDVQKNVLLNGFDSSTDSDRIFKLSTDKIFVAPLPVK
jgi:hypothetical protein